jgi:hypothetical protein
MCPQTNPTQEVGDRCAGRDNYREKFWRFWGIDGLSEAERLAWLEAEQEGHAQAEILEAEMATTED